MSAEPPAPGSETIEWGAWYSETLDALVRTVEEAPVEWGESPEGEPWVVLGDRTSSGLSYPACFIPEFSKVRDETESDHSEELADITATLWILSQSDVKAQEANLRAAIELAAGVETALYSNRSLDRTCKTLSVSSVTPASAVVDGSALQTVEIEVSIRKEALIT